jgi:septal ring factor EnvC (AmiA/AmiB activator)
MKKSKYTFKLFSIALFLFLGLSLSSCWSPSEEDITKLGGTRKAALDAEKTLADKKSEANDLQSQVNAKKAELEKVKAEKEKVNAAVDARHSEESE